MKNTTSLHIRLPTALRAALEECANENRRSISDYVRIALEDYASRHCPAWAGAADAEARAREIAEITAALRRMERDRAELEARLEGLKIS